MDVQEASKRKIKSVAVLGSGVMGSRLACHFANIGLKVYLLDIVPFDLKEEEKDNPRARNRIVETALKTALKSNPSPVYNGDVAKRITTGNFDDNMDWVSKVDWTIEAVVENIKIKNQVFEKVEQYRKPGTLITSNTSGIPISMMLEGRSEDFQAHFCGTHFFNPPRYLRLLEIIPTAKTSPEVTHFLMHFGDLFLGKQTVLCKDTPAFIANRIGVFSIMAIFHLMQEMDLTIEEVDAITGPVSGRPKSATFRTCDLVGIDTLVKVANGVGQNCPNDEAKELFAIPDFVQKMVDNQWFGDKTKQGFYKKTKDSSGNSVIEALDLKTFEYKPKTSPRFESIGAARKAESLPHKLKILAKGTDKAANFMKALNLRVLAYSSKRIPEIANHLYQIDDAMRAGFGWELGPFETWDILGVRKVADAMAEQNIVPNIWVTEMLAAGIESFYKTENGARYYYDFAVQDYQVVPGTETSIVLNNYRSNPLMPKALIPAYIVPKAV